MLGIIQRQILRPLKRHAREIRYSALDFVDFVLGRSDDLTPPRRMVARIGGGGFTAGGQDFLPYFIHYGGLQPDDSILEIGSGAGRMAVALSGYLNAQGRYDGLDIMPDAVAWCREHITAQFKNFRFQLADIYNLKYNPAGRFQASEYRFPYEDSSFDFVILASVFTHMLPPDMRQYLSEISRVLKTGRTCMITYFLLNAESLELVEAGASTQDFRFELDGCRVRNKEVPERAVAYQEEDIRGLYGKLHLEIVKPIRYGSWCGRPEYLSYQDIVVARKRAS